MRAFNMLVFVLAKCNSSRFTWKGALEIHSVVVVVVVIVVVVVVVVAAAAAAAAVVTAAAAVVVAVAVVVVVVVVVAAAAAAAAEDFSWIPMSEFENLTSCFSWSSCRKRRFSCPYFSPLINQV